MTTLRRLLPPSPFVFPSRDGARLVDRTIHAIARSNEFGFNLADLRAAFAIHAVRGGMSLSALHTQLGNRSIAATARYFRTAQEPMTVVEALESFAPA